jgi:hypothetical protein
MRITVELDKEMPAFSDANNVQRRSLVISEFVTQVQPLIELALGEWELAHENSECNSIVIDEANGYIITRLS